LTDKIAIEPIFEIGTKLLRWKRESEQNSKPYNPLALGNGWSLRVEGMPSTEKSPFHPQYYEIKKGKSSEDGL
jgi:hypothetical protein